MTDGDSVLFETKYEFDETRHYKEEVDFNDDVVQKSVTAWPRDLRYSRLELQWIDLLVYYVRKTGIAKFWRRLYPV